MAKWQHTMLVHEIGTVYVYNTTTSLGLHEFEVPVSEMGEKRFEEQLPAQLLIRWLK